MRLLLSVLIALPLVAPPAHPYADPLRRAIATAQDERRPAGLLPFLTHKNAAYRAAAAEALGSVQDAAAGPTLLPLLHEAVPAVRRAAAYALGQTGDSTAAPALAQRLAQPEASAPARRATYEALGRCVTRHSLPLLLRLKPAGPDSANAPGQAWALYRASLRGLATPEVVSRAVALLARGGVGAAPARLGASAALTRAKGLDSVVARVALPVLLKTVAADRNYAVRANCATALSRVARPAAYAALVKAAAEDPDHRVRIAALRALPAKNFIGVLSAIDQGLTKPLAQEALTAAELLLKISTDSLVVKVDFLSDVRRTRHWRARATLLQAALRQARAANRPAIADTIRRRYQRTTNQYQKAALLTALGEDPGQLDFLAETAAQPGPPPIVPGTALAALVSLRGNKNFPAARQADFTAALRRALASGDEAQLSTAAEALANPALVPAPQPADLAALRQARDKLTLPREIEPWIALQQTLDKLEKAPRPTPIPRGQAAQHPIDWALVQRVPVGQRVRLATTQGVIVLELKVAEAPGAVASFVSLVSQHFYDGLYFHRVVPDFVAQGGDPRGDGSGSTPYTLRSELAQLNYGAGAVGLASAGKDTESCQFFVTHLPTPHLDGRYPIFAQVVSGLDVVQRLDVGDRIQTIALVAPGSK